MKKAMILLFFYYGNKDLYFVFYVLGKQVKLKQLLGLAEKNAISFVVVKDEDLI